MKDDISLAQWALVEEHQSGKIKTLDIPRIARMDFDLNGIELVNTLMEVPTQKYLDLLLREARSYQIKIVLIMVDDEGDPCASTIKARKQFVINHKKWIDIAKYLGCKAIRTNCRGDVKTRPSDGLRWAIDSYSSLLEYADTANIEVLIENHGGLSNNADWMVQLFERVDHSLFGSYPDWREPGKEFDNYEYLKKVIPYAGGMSYRNQPTEALTAAMIHTCKEEGYQGWYGIESNGRKAIKEGIRLLKKYLK
ncbi:MAG: sugar phosphate isomerase/epimerase family protein [Chitinophagaceae bacterium]